MEQKKTGGSIFKCPACGNTKSFYETGTTKVKIELTYKNQLEAGEVEIIDWNDFVGGSEITCAICGAKAE